MRNYVRKFEFSNRQLDLLKFVKQAHGKQERKYTFEPYWKHLESVAKIVGFYTQEPMLVEIALCHDLFEDTPTTKVELRAFLYSINVLLDEAEYIINGVTELTDVYTKEAYPELNRAERKYREAHRLSRISPEYQTVKYADLIDNTSSIALHDRHFAMTYLAEKRVILDGMRRGNIDLLIKCCATFQTAWDTLTSKPPFA